jgi:hypothetical protein
MAYKNSSSNNLWVFTVTVMLLFPSTIHSAETNKLELMNLLHEKDQISNMVGYKISFISTTQDNQFRDPNQGMIFSNCQAVWAREDVFAMKKTNYYEKDIPIFRAPGTGGYRSLDYDRDGNLIVWRVLESYILFTPDRNDRIQISKALRIDPNGNLVHEGSSHTTLHRYPINNRGNTYEFNKFQLAIGRGFSTKDFGSITSVKTQSSGMMQVTAHRPSVPALTWELTIDPNSDYLVRKAILTREGENKPTIVVTSSGIMMKDGIKTSKYGTYKCSSSSEISFEVTDISKLVGPNKLYEEVLSQLNSPLPTGASVVDLRGEKPVRTTVK